MHLQTTPSGLLPTHLGDTVTDPAGRCVHAREARHAFGARPLRPAHGAEVHGDDSVEPQCRGTLSARSVTQRTWRTARATAMNISYDSRCRDLAEVFLLDVPQLNDGQHQHELAGVIQMTIETWIACERDAHELLNCPRGDAHDGQGGTLTPHRWHGPHLFWRMRMLVTLIMLAALSPRSWASCARCCVRYRRCAVAHLLPRHAGGQAWRHRPGHARHPQRLPQAQLPRSAKPAYKG